MTASWTEEPELNYAMLAFEDSETGAFLAIQRSLAFDSQDVELGLDTYCLVTGEASYYSGVRTVRVDGLTLEIDLEPEASDVLALRSPVVLGLDEAGASLVRDHLPWLLGGARA